MDLARESIDKSKTNWPNTIKMHQKTIVKEVSLQGKGLHTGEEVTLTLKPAPENTGIVFRRNDLYGKPELKAHIEFVTDLVRGTTLAQDTAKVNTVEHVLSALQGMGIDNVYVELTGGEPPILDGSAKHYVNLIQMAETCVQNEEKKFIELVEPISITEGNRSLIALPYDGLRITCTSSDDRGIHTQHLSLDIEPEAYASEIAPARTFTIYEDIEPLLKLGKIKGGSLESAIVIKGNKILSKEPLRFQDEFVRHKILDLIGDITLLGKPLKAHIIAVRPGHALNAKLTKRICQSVETPHKFEAPQHVVTNEVVLDIKKILQLLPHRYPFVLLDRIVKIEGETLQAIKNVTINEPFFQGHFPGNPVMPGVLQLEAMAQAAGILMSRNLPDYEEKLTFFMSADKVKFRQVVEPGDQLCIEVKLLKVKNGKIGTAEGVCRVGNTVVSSAELMFMILDAKR